MVRYSAVLAAALLLAAAAIAATYTTKGTWYVVSINKTLPTKNGTHHHLLDAATYCVLEGASGLVEVAGAECEPGLAAEYDGKTIKLPEQTFPPQYRASLTQFYVVGFKLADYSGSTPDFELVRFNFRLVRDYYYIESQGRYIISEVFQRAWGQVRRSSDYCASGSPLTTLATDVANYMYSNWGVQLPDNSVLYIYLLGELNCLKPNNVGGASGYVTINTAYGTRRIGVVVVYHPSDYRLRDIFTPAHLIGYLIGLRPVTGERTVLDGPTLMGAYCHSVWIKPSPSATWDVYCIPFNILAYQKKLIGWLGPGLKIPLSNLQPGSYVLNSPTRHYTKTYVLVTTASDKGYLIELTYVPLYRYWWYDWSDVYFVDNSTGKIIYVSGALPFDFYTYTYDDYFGIYGWYLYIERVRFTLGDLWRCDLQSSYVVGANAAVSDVVGAISATAEIRPAWWGLPWSYLDRVVVSGTSPNWNLLSRCVVSFGGPLVNAMTGLYNPVNKVGYGGLPFYYDTGAGGIRDARTGQVYTGSRVFLVAVLNTTAPYHRFIILAWGNGGEGTYAAGIWIRNFYYKAWDKYAVVVRWDDTNNNGLPDSYDSYTVLAAWP